jgi:hypothetical protein
VRVNLVSCRDGTRYPKPLASNSHQMSPTTRSTAAAAVAATAVSENASGAVSNSTRMAPSLVVDEGEILLYDSRTTRSQHWPIFYEVDDHPLLPSDTSYNRILVYCQDTRHDAMQALFDYSISLELLFGPDQVMEGTGAPFYFCTYRNISEASRYF